MNISSYQQQKNEVLQFPSTSFQILNCYIIVHYKYLLPMWVAILLSLSNFFIFMQLILSVCHGFYKNILN